MGLQIYTHGIKPVDGSAPHMPEPYVFVLGSVAMGAVGVLAMANARVGTLFAWALLIGAFVADYTAQHGQETQKAALSSSPQNPLPVPTK
jgi:hypothetical protein